MLKTPESGEDPADGPTGAEPPAAWQWDDWTWHATTGRLCLRGAAVEIGSRAFDLLGRLLARQGQVLSKDEAFREVWPGRVVEENNLQVQVATLRRLLGREAIVTIPGRGYRLAAVARRLASGATAPGPAAAPAQRSGLDPTSGADMALPDPMIGREADLAALDEAFRHHVLVTIVGEGGMGKTTLARAWMARLPGGHAQATVDLSELAGLRDLAAALARPWGLQWPNGADEDAALGALADGWPVGACWLFVDNGEHVRDDIARILARLLRVRPALRVLVTSQVRLNLAAEGLHRLGPLALPGADDWDTVQASPAVQLLLRRAHAAGAFTPQPRHAHWLARLCRQLDGLPLAIELAAAQVARLGLPAVCEHLGDRLRLLQGGPVDRPARQRTLAATLAWSHALLDPAEAIVFRRVSVFAGSFNLEAALTVCSDEQLDRWGVTEALAALVDRCLVSAMPGRDGRDGPDDGDPGSDAPRYRLLASTRAFADAQCRTSGEREATARRHARWMHGRFEQAYEELGRRSDTGWREAFGLDLDNLRAALQFCLTEGGAPDLGIGLSGWSADLWPLLSLLDDGRRHLEMARLHLRPDTPARDAAALWDGIGYLWQDADPRRALQARLQAEALWRSVGDRRWVRSVLGQAWNRLYTDELDVSEQALAETADAVEGHGHLRALHRTTLGALRQRQGRPAEALQAYEEALALRRAQGDERRTLIMLLNLGDLACSSGRAEEAVQWGRQAEAEARRQGDEALLSVILGNLTTALLFGDRIDDAAVCAREATPLLARSDGLLYFLDTLAWLACRQGRLADAAHLLGAADTALAAQGVARQPAEEQVVRRLCADLEPQIGAERLATWRAQGRTWSAAEVRDRVMAA